MRLESISRKVRARFFYSVPIAGAKIELGRSQSYRAAEVGLIPTVRKGKFLPVPRKRWDRTVKRLLRGGNAPPAAAKPGGETVAKNLATGTDAALVPD